MDLLSLSLTLLLWQSPSDGLPAGLDLLSRIKIKMAENLSRLPNYTCVETIERSRRMPASRKFEPVDKIHLEVALVEGNEVFGWPGGDKIAEKEITNLVGGTIGNGVFALFLKSVFQGSGATFRYAGDSTVDARRAIKFDYQVLLLSSGYHLKVPPREALVPYHGSFWVEPNTLDLMRLELIADAIPPYLGISAASNAMEYARVEIGGSKFLLPRSSELDLTDLNGEEKRNLTRFTACRQFTGESVLVFGDASSDSPAAQTSPVRHARLPKDFLAEFSLKTAIDSDTSAVGDFVRARLQHDIKVPQEPAIPKGAELTGRISRLERMGGSCFLEIDVLSIDYQGGHADLTGRENEIAIQFSTKVFRPGLGSRASEDPFTLVTMPARIPAGRFEIGPGSRINLRSRLLQSE
jgi:hypothetical protein